MRGIWGLTHMSPRYLSYKLWSAGRLPGHVPSFSDVGFWLSEGTPPAGAVEVEVTHQHTVTRR